MANEELAAQVMALPLPERVDLAQALWQSIDDGLPAGADDEREAVDAATRRDAELTSGVAVGRSNEQVMDAARRILGCA